MGILNTGGITDSGNEFCAHGKGIHFVFPDWRRGCKNPAAFRITHECSRTLYLCSPLKIHFSTWSFRCPIMLILALILASILNNRNLRFKGLFRTMIFLPCATSLVAYATIFRTLFANNGIINLFLVKIGILDAPYSFLTHPISAKIVIILGLLWRWTGYQHGILSVRTAEHWIFRIWSGKDRRSFSGADLL